MENSCMNMTKEDIFRYFKGEATMEDEQDRLNAISWWRYFFVERI